MPPNAQPACSEDMIGLPRSFSTFTPWLFIATSCVAEEAPSTNSPSATSSGCGASTGRIDRERDADAADPDDLLRAVAHDRLAGDREGEDDGDRHRRR